MVQKEKYYLKYKPDVIEFAEMNPSEKAARYVTKHDAAIPSNVNLI